MSIIETLTEGIVNRNMQEEGAALLNKWSQTGLLEGLSDDNQKASMARLLENQAKELLRESSSMGTGGSVEGFAAVAFPIVRRVFAGLIANDLVSVQPMSLPSGLIFFMDFTYSGQIGETTTTGRFGNAANDSIYGTDRVGSEVTGGVNLVGALGENLSGPRNMVGYAYASPTGSITAANSSGAAHRALVEQFTISAATEAQKKRLEYDPDLLDLAATDAFVVDIAKSLFDTGNADFDNLSAFNITATTLGALTGLTTAATIVRRLTSVVPDGQSSLTSNVPAVRFVIVEASATAGSLSFGADIAVEIAVADSIGADANAAAGAINAYEMLLENNVNIPEIDIKVDSIAITAQTKKLKAKWTPELGQDLNAYHNLDAEVELTSILSEQIALELDREILADLVNGATAATYYWSRSPGLFVNRETGAELGATSAAPDFTGTVSEWYETLIETINDVSAQIHRKTLRGGANYIVTSPEVANILEFTAGFRANVTADADKGDIGAVKVGALNRKFDVIVDPYFPRNAILVGRKGASFLESGYVYAPYVPLQTTPTIFGPEDFVPRKGVMTRYAKKMVRPDMYGLVICRGLLGESGS
jgi:hypothetical protein